MLYDAEAKRLEIALTGDSLITRRLSTYSEPDFLVLRDLLKEADVAFTNLEVVLGEEPDYPAEFCGGNWLGVPEYIADELSWLGFNLFSAANNHGGDFGAGGALSTIKELRKRELVFAGLGEDLARARQPGYMDLGRGRVALVAASASLPHGSSAGEQRQDFRGRPGVNPLHHEVAFKVKPEILKMLKQVADDAQITAMREERARSSYDKPDAEGELKFLDYKFVASDVSGVSSKPNERDFNDILKWVKDGKRQADFCFVSLHAHEAHVLHEKPAEFVEIFARACIDAGADGYFGHGPHILRGIEIYKGKPIFYSLGNFMMQSPTIRRIPVDMYTKYDIDPFTSTPADIFDKRLARERIRQTGIYYESALARLTYDAGAPTKIVLHPVHLGTASARPQQGRPLRARGELAVKILKDLQRLSEPYGTRISIDGETGYVELP
ncbi:MAG: CapA family protein [Bacillota bacterium]|nr:CapA family protein [Bacillota bacterium]